MISAVLYWLPVQRRCYSVEQENSLKPLCKAIVHSRSWVGNSVNTFRTKTEHKKKKEKKKLPFGLLKKKHSVTVIFNVWKFFGISRKQKRWAKQREMTYTSHQRFRHKGLFVILWNLTEHSNDTHNEHRTDTHSNALTSAVYGSFRHHGQMVQLGDIFIFGVRNTSWFVLKEFATCPQYPQMAKLNTWLHPGRHERQ